MPPVLPAQHALARGFTAIPPVKAAAGRVIGSVCRIAPTVADVFRVDHLTPIPKQKGRVLAVKGGSHSRKYVSSPTLHTMAGVRATVATVVVAFVGVVRGGITPAVTEFGRARHVARLQPPRTGIFAMVPSFRVHAPCARARVFATVTSVVPARQRVVDAQVAPSVFEAFYRAFLTLLRARVLAVETAGTAVKQRRHTRHAAAVTPVVPKSFGINGIVAGSVPYPRRGMFIHVHNDLCGGRNRHRRGRGRRGQGHIYAHRAAALGPPNAVRVLPARAFEGTGRARRPSTVNVRLVAVLLAINA